LEATGYREGKVSQPTKHRGTPESAAQDLGQNLLVGNALRCGNSSGLANNQPFPSLGSRDKPAQKPDGSTDLYLGPKAPEGKASNWLATVPGKGCFVLLRLYGPTEASFNKSWKPGDFEKIKDHEGQ
jgi:uncharacterized protein DUF1214